MGRFTNPLHGFLLHGFFAERCTSR